MLAAVERHPELRPLLPMYAATLIPASKLMMRGANGEIQTIDSMSEEGGHQGCASTGAAFCLALHPSVQAADATLAAVGGYARFFADDGYLVGPRDAVLEALTAFEAQVRRECGLRLNRGKTEWHAASAAEGERARGDMEASGLRRGESVGVLRDSSGIAAGVGASVRSGASSTVLLG